MHSSLTDALVLIATVLQEAPGECILDHDDPPGECQLCVLWPKALASTWGYVPEEELYDMVHEVLRNQTDDRYALVSNVGGRQIATTLAGAIAWAWEVSEEHCDCWGGPACRDCRFTYMPDYVL